MNRSVKFSFDMPDRRNQDFALLMRTTFKIASNTFSQPKNPIIPSACSRLKSLEIIIIFVFFGILHHHRLSSLSMLPAVFFDGFSRRRFFQRRFRMSASRRRRGRLLILFAFAFFRDEKGDNRLQLLGLNGEFPSRVGKILRNGAFCCVT